MASNAGGSRWQPQWKAWRRVKVSFEQLNLWYPTLDDLLPERGRIEKEIYFRLRDLFSLQPDLVFYDLTSTYFEGQGPAELARCGYSRDGKPCCISSLLLVSLDDAAPSLFPFPLLPERDSRTDRSATVADVCLSSAWRLSRSRLAASHSVRASSSRLLRLSTSVFPTPADGSAASCASMTRLHLSMCSL